MDGFKGFTNPASSNNVTGVLLVRIELKVNRAFAALHTADGNVFIFLKRIAARRTTANPNTHADGTRRGVTYSNDKFSTFPFAYQLLTAIFYSTCATAPWQVDAWKGERLR